MQSPRATLYVRKLKIGILTNVGHWTLDSGLTIFARASRGESVAIVGASGAGKSTLLNLLGGLEAPDHGSIALGAFAIDRARSSELAIFRRHQIGFIFQFHYLGRKSRPAAMEQARASLADMGLKGREDHPVGDLSGGEQQRVATCRALIKQPALVLADEPTGNLDAPAAQELAANLISYAQRHRAIVIIATHNEKLAQLCDQTLRIDEGRLKVVSDRN